MITQNNPQYSPLIANVVNNRNWASGVQDLARGYAKPLMLIDALNPNGSYSIEGPEGELRVAFQPRQEIVATVATVTQSGANLILTWTDSNYDGFRTKMSVMDSNHNFGYVIASGPGTITISPATNPTTLSSASHFLAGSSVLEMGSAAGNQYSSGVGNVYKTNDFRLNYSAVVRESYTVSRREKFVSFKFDETYYAYTVNEVQMLQRFMKKKVFNMVFSEPGQFIGLEGTTNRYQGLRAAVRDQGGRFISQPVAFNQADFEADLMYMATTDPAQHQNYLWIGGREAWSIINSFYAGDITFTVSKAVINGNEINFDITKATINGVTVSFMTWGVFDDIVSFPTISTVTGTMKESNTYAILNLNDLPDVVGGGMIPSVRKFYFASGDTGGLETLYRYIPGMIGPGTSNNTGGSVWNGYQLGTSPTDGGQMEILEDCGVDFTADACVWRELSA